MGPTNIALVKLSHADKELREASSRLEAASKAVRIQERRIKDLQEKLQAAQTSLREQQAHMGAFELDVKTRDAHIERLRTQQQNARNNKEYQAFLTEINTEKIDKSKAEDELVKVMLAVETAGSEIKTVQVQLAEETTRHAEIKLRLADRLAELQAQIDSLQPVRDAVAALVPPHARETFERLADRYEGEAMGPVTKPDRRREEYVCGTCNMDLVVDIYNRLHSRDEMVFCPNCRRLLFIPDDLPPELAIHTKPAKKEKGE